MSKHAIVTGASSGIGLATANSLLQQNYKVLGLARDFSQTDTVGFNTMSLDLSDLDALALNLKSNAELASAPQLLLLNAGYGRFGGIEQFSHTQIRHLIDTNLVSNLYLLKHFVPLMKASGEGDIVLVGSESALQGAKAGAVYCATKFAIRGLAQSLRADCSNAGIRVTLVNPGPVDSDFFDELKFAPMSGQEFAIDSNDVAEAILHAIAQPANVVTEEINLQPLKRSFKKKT